jgi:hypothetical protein
MAEVNTFRCDGPGCDKVKGQSNHWFIVRRALGEFHLWAWDAPQQPPVMTGIRPEHYCSELCAAKALSSAIGSKSKGE